MKSYTLPLYKTQVIVSHKYTCKYDSVRFFNGGVDIRPLARPFLSETQKGKMWGKIVNTRWKTRIQKSKIQSCHHGTPLFPWRAQPTAGLKFLAPASAVVNVIWYQTVRRKSKTHWEKLVRTHCLMFVCFLLRVILSLCLWLCEGKKPVTLSATTTIETVKHLCEDIID